MKTKLVKIGNSRGVRIPRPMIEESGLSDEVEIVVGENAILIRPVRRPREGWAEAFEKAARENPDDVMIDGDGMGLSSFDEEEWEW